MEVGLVVLLAVGHVYNDECGDLGNGQRNDDRGNFDDPGKQGSEPQETIAQSHDDNEWCRWKTLVFT